MAEKESKSMELVEKELRLYITDLESEILTTTDKTRLCVLKAVVYFIEDNWKMIVNDIVQRQKV
jgi:hypothetical protein